MSFPSLSQAVVKYLFSIFLILIAASCATIEDDGGAALSPNIVPSATRQNFAQPQYQPQPYQPQAYQPVYQPPMYQPQYQQMPPQSYYYQQQPTYYPPQGGSRYYSNPYAIPPSSRYPYYDSDQYYVPPTYYNNLEKQVYGNSADSNKRDSTLSSPSNGPM
jgi:hypothetical protein